MTRSTYFEDFVWIDYEQFRAEPGSISLAMNAVVAAYHVAEWIAAYDLASCRGGSPSADDVDRQATVVREAAFQACPGFDLLEDVVTAYKHVVTRPHAAAKRPRLFTELVRVQTQATPTIWRDEEVWDDDKQWYDDYDSVVVVDDNNNKHEILMLLNRVVAYWGDSLFRASAQWLQRRPDVHAGKGILR